VTLIAGGQDASLVTGRMIKLGWKKNANRVLTGPSPLTGTGNAGAYAESMAKVQAGNSDVLFAGSSASLSQARTWSSGRPKSAAPGAPPQPHRHPPKHLTASQASQLTGLAASPRFWVSGLPVQARQARHGFFMLAW
jgi:hypothetical protein